MRELSRTQELVFYYGLIAAVLTGIVAAVVIIVADDSVSDSFSSLYFPHPDTVPHKVRVGQELSFDYGVRSHENETKEYSIQSVLTLYELYDETEGLYNCLAPFRKTVYLRLENVSNASRIEQERVHEIIPDFALEPDLLNLLDWDEYHAHIRFHREFGNGTLLLYFANETNTHYSIVLDTVSGDAFVNGEWFSSVSFLRDEIELLLHFHSGNLDILLDGVVHRVYNVSGGGQFGFQSRGILSKVLMTTYKDTPIEIPDRGNVWRYEIDLSEYYKHLFRLRDLSLLSFRTGRVFVDEDMPVNCSGEFSCSYSSSVRSDYHLEGFSNMSSVLLSLPAPTVGNAFFLQTARENDSRIPFEVFSLSSSVPSVLQNDSFTFVFGEQLGVIVSGRSLSFLQLVDGVVFVEQHPLRVNSSLSSVLVFVNVSDSFVHVSVGNRVFESALLVGVVNASLRVFHHNTFRSVGTIRVHYDSDECATDEPFVLCEVVYEVPASATPPAPSGDLLVTREVMKQPVVVSSLDVPSTETSQDLVEEEVFVEESFIPRQVYAYNGPLTTIVNRTNSTFSTNFLALEGDGFVEVTFMTLTDHPAIRVSVFPSRNVTNIAYEHRGEFFDQNYSIGVDGFTDVSLHVGRDIISVRQNRSVVAQFRNNNVRDGYYVLSTQGLHADFRDTIINFDGLQTRRLPTSDDPCQLREVYQTTLRSNRFLMSSGTNHTFTDEVLVDQQFDYGTFSVFLDGSSNTDVLLEIRAWLVRE